MATFLNQGSLGPRVPWEIAGKRTRTHTHSSSFSSWKLWILQTPGRIPCMEDQPSIRQYLNSTTQTEKMKTYVHALSGIWSHNPCVWMGEDILCLRLHKNCTGLSLTYNSTFYVLDKLIYCWQHTCSLSASWHCHHPSLILGVHTGSSVLCETKDSDSSLHTISFFNVSKMCCKNKKYGSSMTGM
jgi:hypothetical protein